MKNLETLHQQLLEEGKKEMIRIAQEALAEDESLDHFACINNDWWFQKKDDPSITGKVYEEVVSMWDFMDDWDRICHLAWNCIIVYRDRVKEPCRSR